MNCDVTLKAKEFKDLHNAKCALYHLISDLASHDKYASAASKRLVKDLTKIHTDMSKSLKNAYAQEDKVSDERRAVYEAMAEANGLTAIWSMYEVEDMTLPHPYKNVSKVVHKNHWGKTAVAVEIEGDRWGDLYKAADAAIKLSGDTHHSFIEGFGTEDVAKGNLLLHTGS